MKRIKMLLYGIIFTLVFIPIMNVNAASAVVDIYSSNKNPAVGSTITVTAYVKSAEPLGSYYYTLVYNSSKLQLISGELTNADTARSANTKSLSKSFTFKVIGAGSSSISAKACAVYGWNESVFNCSVSGVTINSYVKTYTPVVYSTNNYLKNLTIDGQTISPAFNKNTAEYKVSLGADVTSIKINATVEDSTAKVNGAGVVNVEEGDNKINVVVTSQKGTTRTYTIIASVIDNNPINVTLNNKNYTVMKRLASLEKPNNCVDGKIKINELDIPTYTCEITKYTLVGLKDEEGNPNLYIYDEKEKTYNKYNEFTFQSLKLNILDKENEFNKYKKTTIKINDIEVPAYKYSKQSKFSLIYAMNIETGNKSWYVYEETENTIQKYDNEIIDLYENKIEKANVLIYSFAGGMVLLSIIIIIVLVSKPKKNKKIKNIDIEDDILDIKKKIKKEKKKKNKSEDKDLNKDDDTKDEKEIINEEDAKIDKIEKELEDEVNSIIEKEGTIKDKPKKKKKDLFEDW